LLVVAALLVSPLGWLYYLWLAGPPAASWYLRSRPWGSWRRVVVAALAPGLTWPLTAASIALLPAVLAGGLSTWELLGLWLLLVAPTLSRAPDAASRGSPPD
jgi:hypothetical protein